jgi:hypothetical protein
LDPAQAPAPVLGAAAKVANLTLQPALGAGVPGAFPTSLLRLVGLRLQVAADRVHCVVLEFG